MKIEPFVITLLLGFSFFIGYMITLFIKKDKRLFIFNIGLSFLILLNVNYDLLLESIYINNKIMMILCMLCGFGVIKILDGFTFDNNKKNIDNNNGLVLTLILCLYSIINGINIYNSCINNLELGIYKSLYIMLNNIILGTLISLSIIDKKERVKLLILLVISSIFGIILTILFNITISDMSYEIMSSLIFGMFIYILFKIVRRIKYYFKYKELKIGLLIGVVFIILRHLL